MKRTAGNITAFAIGCFIIKAFPKVVLCIVIFFILIIIFVLIREALRTNKVKQFMKQNNGKYFISYSSNKRLKPFIETKLKPLFDFDYTIIYNNRNKIESELNAEIINYLQNQSVGLKLPILYKVTKEKIIVTSFYEDVYEFKEQRIIQEVFKTRINNKLKTIIS
jgi:hypothetical protein